MSGCDEWSLFKALEVFLCVSCLIFKWWTDYEASRLFFFLEKQSREWPLLNNVTWNQSGSWFADVTFGGYTIICIALFVAHLIGELKSTRKTECFLLGIGSLLFIGVGLMVLSSFDSVPDDLFDNALILGALALITGFTFLIDIGCFGKKRGRSSVNDVVKQSKDVIIINENATKNTIVDNHDVPEKPSSASLPRRKRDEDERKIGGRDSTDDSGRGGGAKFGIVEELRSSFKKKSDVVSKESEIGEKADNKLQTNENVTVTGRRYMDNRGFSKGSSTIKVGDDFPIENYNNYDYERHSMRKYDRQEEPKKEHYDRTDEITKIMSDSQIQTEEIISKGDMTSGDRHRRTVTNKRDVETSSTTRNNNNNNNTKVEYATLTLQSPRITSSGFQQTVLSSGNPSSSDETYERHTASVSYLLSEKGRKIAPTLSPARIQKLTHCNNNDENDVDYVITTKVRCGCRSQGGNSEPTSPQDKGYVLHTASKWPNPNPLLPDSYKKPDRQKNGSIIHSDV